MDSRQVPRNINLEKDNHFQPPHPQARVASPAPSTTSTVHSVDSHVPHKKRRTSAMPSPSRGVANLTPEQLAKKRANDREAQRAIRERTRTQIETLERRIHELSSQQPQQELQASIRQQQAVEAENAQIKETLKAAVALLQPLLHGQGAQSFNVTSRGRRNAPSHSPMASQQAAPPTPLSNPIQPIYSQYSDTASVRSSTTASPSFGVPSPSQRHHSQGHPSPVGSPPQYTSRGPVYQSSAAALNQQRHDLTHGLNMTPAGERLNLGFLLDGRQTHQTSGSPNHRIPPFPRLSANIQQPDRPAAVQTPKPHDGFEPSLLAHNIPIRNILPTCPLDTILLDFLADRRARAAEGASPTNLVGPAYPSVSSLLNPATSLYAHPLSKVFTDILSKFPDLDHLPEQVAVLYVMFLIMRWQISPTKESYDRLPDWITPRPSQLFTPHPAWVDHLPWPRMRDRMVEMYHEISLDEWFIPYTTTLSLNWPYEECDTLLSLPRGGSDRSGEGSGGGSSGDGSRPGSGGEEEQYTINPVFERHLRDLGNWTLGPAFEKAFPNLRDTCKIRTEERGGGRRGR